MKKILKWGAAVLFLVFFVSVAALFLYQYQRMPREVYSELDARSQNITLLALTRYLEQRTIPIRHTPLSRFLLSSSRETEHAILLNREESVNADSYDQLLWWIEKGGHLIMSAYAAQDGQENKKPQLLLKSLGIEVADQQMPTPVEELGEEATSFYELLQHITKDDRIQVTLDESKAYSITIPETTALTANDDVDVRYQGDNQYGTQWMQIQHGKGRVSIFKTFAPLDSHSLLEADHLLFILKLLEIPTQDGHQHPGVTLLHPQAQQPLWLIAVQTAPLWFAGVLIVAFIFGWHALARFGPVRPLPDPPRSSRLIEHIEASGRLVWRHRVENSLIKRLRERLWRRIAQRFPGVTQQNSDHAIQLLAERTHLRPEVIYNALYADKGVLHRRKQFVAKIAAIQQVSRNL